MKIQANIIGYSGQPKTIVALLDDATGNATISKGLTTFRPERIAPDFALIANYQCDADFPVSDDDLCEAIAAYFERTQIGKITLSEGALALQPDSYIELDGVTESGGRRYRIGPDINSGQVGVLATALFCKRQDAIRACIQLMNDGEADYEYFQL